MKAALLLAALAAPEREDWVARDRAVLDRVNRAWNLASAEEAVRILGGDVREDRDIGFGGRRWRLALYGGHATAWVTVVAFQGKVAELDARCDDAPESLHEAWKSPRTRRVPEVIAAFAAAREKALGRVPEAEDTLLSSATADLVFGTVFGYDGAPPPGREAADALVKAKDVARLGRALRGPNPEGRVYAAEALQKLGGLSDADRAAIEAVRKLDVKIACCEGCTLLQRKAAEIL